MMYGNPFPEISQFEWKDLHKKIGQVYVLSPTESDIAEGDFFERVYFRTEKEMYVLFERDTRLSVNTEKRGEGG